MKVLEESVFNEHVQANDSVTQHHFFFFFQETGHMVTSF